MAPKFPAVSLVRALAIAAMAVGSAAAVYGGAQRLVTMHASAHDTSMQVDCADALRSSGWNVQQASPVVQATDAAGASAFANWQAAVTRMDLAVRICPHREVFSACLGTGCPGGTSTVMLGPEKVGQ